MKKIICLSLYSLFVEIKGADISLLSQKKDPNFENHFIHENSLSENHYDINSPWVQERVIECLSYLGLKKDIQALSHKELTWKGVIQILSKAPRSVECARLAGKVFNDNVEVSHATLPNFKNFWEWGKRIISAGEMIVTGGILSYMATEVVREKSKEKVLPFSGEGNPLTRPLSVALLGDSLSWDFFFRGNTQSKWKSVVADTSIALSIKAGNMGYLGGWFSDTQVGLPESFIEKVGRNLSVIHSVNYAVPMANLGVRQDWRERAIGMMSFLDQVKFMKKRLPPSVTIVWIGHNELDWRRYTSVFDLNSAFIQRLINKVNNDYQRGFDTLNHFLSKNIREGEERVVVYMGLVNLDSFFKERNRCLTQKNKNSSLYPYFYPAEERAYLSLKKEHSEGMIQWGLELNRKIKDLVEFYQAHPQRGLYVYYSQAFAGITPKEMQGALHPKDAWHPSIKGHHLLAEKAFESIAPILLRHFSD